jgi:hypothetical protein
VKGPPGRSTITVGPNEIRQLAFTLYATATLAADGAPLAPGTYVVHVADQNLTFVVQ